MSYAKEREEFIGRFVQCAPGATFEFAQWLLRQASAEQRWNEVYSSFDIGEDETARQERKSERRMERVKERVESAGFKLETNGDPRGNPFCVLVGPTEIRHSVPGRGLPARCF